MTGRWLATISRWVTVLLVASLLPFVTVQSQIVALVVLGLQFTVLIRRTDRLERLAALVNVIAPPLIAESIWSGASVVLLAVPGLPWFASVLRTTRSPLTDESSPLLRLRDRRYLSDDGVVLILSLLGAALVGVLTGHLSIVASSGILLCFMGLLVTVSWKRIPRDFLTAQPPTVRVLARDTLQARVPLRPQVRIAAHIALHLDNPWVAVVPRVLIAGRELPVVQLRVTPPLAGSKTLQAWALCADPWGLTVTAQDLVLAHVRVIPRATYAAWLARRYLERTEGGHLAATMLQEARGAAGARRGLDYYGARPYEPGDPLRDVFWKHTLKLQQLVVKERRSEYSETVILAVNVWGADAEDLDRAAFNALLATLTLAREGVPMVFATYTDDAVLGVTPVLAPRQAVLHALHLVGTMSEVPRPARLLQPAHLARLRRRVERLTASNTDPALRLARVLQFEYQAHLNRAQRHPGYRAVLTAASRVAAPAALLVASSGPDDPEAIELALERLRRRGVHPFIALNGAKMPAFPIPPDRRLRSLA
jgi:uncharacterized protein (DUF58 family)